MALWIAFAVLTAAVVAWLMQPLRAPRYSDVSDGAEADIAVYRDQLAEIDAERERGLISDSDGESARAEVARRLIRRSEGAAPGADAKGAFARSATGALYTVAGLVPLAAVALYVAIGAPRLPDKPLAERSKESEMAATVTDLIGKVEARLAAHPEDGQGWDVIAPIYLRIGRFGDAAHAYAQASRLLGESPKRLRGFAEASLLVGNGVVSEDVRRAAERLLALEPARPEARVWLALAKEQDGNLAGAISDYEALLKEAPADATWRGPVEARLAEVRQRKEGGGGVAAAPSGTAPAGDGAEQQAMIQTMVDGLAARLKQDGRDLPGWMKLVRSYKVLGRDSDAAGALAEARKTFASDGASLAELDELAKSLGMGS